VADMDFTHRTQGLLGDQGLESLERPLIAIAGLGGVGGLRLHHGQA
jgi:tRNA A37 threonylcarbamoyladenosine dehydratase